MKTSLTETENQGHKGLGRTRFALMGAIGILLVSSLSAGVALGAGYNAVQIFVTTGAQEPYSYTFTAYNSTGSQVATYQGNYPAAAFELPNGVYLFTVSAVYQQSVYCGCVYPEGTATGTSNAGAVTSTTAHGMALSINSTGGNTNSTTGSNSTKPVPIFRVYEPKSEYGWKEVDVTASQTITIKTMNVTEIPTENVTVKVSFVNGTAAAGASVSASIIGQWYYWWGDGVNVTMWAQTGSDGTATLTLPVAPAMITAWNWVNVGLPVSKTVTVNVGGQKINVTDIWGPAYVGLSGSATLVPPATSVSITLTYQQPTYWVEPMTAQTAPGVSSTGATAGTVASAPTGVPTVVRQTTTLQSGQDQYYQPSQIAALEAVVGPSKSSSLPLGGYLPLAAAGAAIVVLSVLAAVVLTRKERPPAPLT